MITEVTGFLQQTDRIVWGPWLIFLLLGCGCYLMISLFFLPLRNLLAALGLVFHPKSRKGTDGEGVSSFSALTTELAATKFFTIIIPMFYLNYLKEVPSEAFIFIQVPENAAEG